MPRRAATNIGLGDFLDGDRGLHSGADPELLEGILQREAVDDGRKHAHVVAGRAIDAEGAAGKPAEDVATSDHDRELAAQIVDLLDLPSEGADSLGADTESRAPGERFPADLQQDAPVSQRRTGDAGPPQ